MADLCRHCFRPTNIEPNSCPCYGDGSAESERDCYRLGIEARDAQLTQAQAEIAALKFMLERKELLLELSAAVIEQELGGMSNARFDELRALEAATVAKLKESTALTSGVTQRQEGPTE